MAANFFEFQQQMRTQRAAPQASPAAKETPLTVSELTAKIAKVINTGMPSSVLVRGEVSNYRPNKSSGHLYFTLKDEEACLDCVMFRGDAVRLKFQPGDGMELLAGGRIGVFPARGRYQLYISTLRPLGQGALELAFQQVRRKLEAEGLFAAERKKPLPAYPMRIGIVTSREAAALQDILKVLRRFSWLSLCLYSVPVQGEGAHEKIAAAIAHVNATIGSRGGADVILLARGGGSLEDLWNFNEESVARAIAASRIPVVTGIGHEVDVSIADLVADHHAHTPTEAAQVITANWRGAEEQLHRDASRLSRGLRVLINDGWQRVRSIERHETFRRPTDRLNILRQLLDERQRGLEIGVERLINSRRERVHQASARLARFLPSFMNRSRELLNLNRQQLDQKMAARLRKASERVSRAEALLQECHPRFRVTLTAQRIDAMESRLTLAMRRQIAEEQLRLEARSRQLEAVSPPSVLRRGYSITTRKKDGVTVREASQVKAGEKIITRFADGTLESTVNDTKQLSLFD